MLYQPTVSSPDTMEAAMNRRNVWTIVLDGPAHGLAAACGAARQIADARTYAQKEMELHCENPLRGRFGLPGRIAVANETMLRNWLP